VKAVTAFDSQWIMVRTFVSSLKKQSTKQKLRSAQQSKTKTRNLLW